MAVSTLSKLLSLFENSSGAMSVNSLARELEISPERVEGLIDFWVRKGKITSSSSLKECGNCSTKGDCPFILELPLTYELVEERDGKVPEMFRPACR